jgi:hypothetical protein
LNVNLIVGVVDIAKNCKRAIFDDEPALECFVNILDLVSEFDPTGLSGLVSSLIFDECDYSLEDMTQDLSDLRE